MIGPYGVGEVGDYTDEINIIPNMFTKIAQANLFVAEPVSLNTVIIDRVENEIVVLPEVPRGAEATRAKGEVIGQLPLLLPHIPHDDFLMPSDVQDRRAPGSTGPDTLTRKRTSKMINLRMKHAQTLEWLQMGAIKGTIVGGSGNTIYNLFTEFGYTEANRQKTWDMATSSDMGQFIREAKRYIELNTFAGVTISRYWCICSTTFFDNFIKHPSVVRAYQYYSSRQEPLRNDVRTGFEYMGIWFEEYNGATTLMNGDPGVFVPDLHAFMLPLGVPGMFTTYYGPANRMGYVNTDGQELYLFEYPDPKDRFISMESESNPLPICNRPQAVVDITAIPASP